jgi:hypothetical protein
MKTRQILSIFAILILALSQSSCDLLRSDEGFSRDITKLVPETTLNNMISMGMPVYDGKRPPDLEGTFYVSPFVLVSSNRPGDYPGREFADYKFTLYDQNNSKLEIVLDFFNGPETGAGLGSYISGSGNNFSVFAKVESYHSDGSRADVVHVLSGTLVDDGIANFYFSNFMLNNYGNPSGYWMDEGQGRVIYDSDGSSFRISSPMKTDQTIPGCAAK